MNSEEAPVAKPGPFFHPVHEHDFVVGDKVRSKHKTTINAGTIVSITEAGVCYVCWYEGELPGIREAPNTLVHA